MHGNANGLDRGAFHKFLANRSLCFVGPANTSWPMQSDLCASSCEIVFVTNNMISLLQPSSCYAVVLVTNRYFGHRLVERPALAHKATAVLCTFGPTCNGLLSRGVHNRTLAMAAPAVGGVANSLPYVLKAICDINGNSGCAGFSRLHITGVTFYDNGAQYTSGYRLLNESSRHEAQANKAYSLSWVRKVALQRRVSIDYPRCVPWPPASLDETSVPAAGRAAAGLGAPDAGSLSVASPFRRLNRVLEGR